VKFHATRRGAQIDDRKAGDAGRGGLTVGVASLPFLDQRAEEVLDQLKRRRGSDVLGEVAAARLQDPVDLNPIQPGKGSRPAGAVWMTWTPRGPSRSRATSWR